MRSAWFKHICTKAFLRLRTSVSARFQANSVSGARAASQLFPMLTWFYLPFDQCVIFPFRSNTDSSMFGAYLSSA